MEKATDRAIHVHELRLHYLDWGGGGDKIILLLHGFMGHARVWDDLALALCARYRVLALDQRGHGDSEWSKDASYGMDRHFTDLSRFIDSLGVQKIMLVGHSMGGRNALFYTACVPEKVERLVLVDARLGNSPEASVALRRQLASLPLEAKALGEVVEALRSLYPYLPVKTCRHIAGHGYVKTRDGTFVPKYDARMSLQLEKAAYTTDDLWRMMQNVTCPTLLVRGEESPFVSREEARSTCAALPGARFQEIAGATHMPAQENPEAFKRAVLDFLDEP